MMSGVISNIIVIVVLVLVVGGACLYIRKEKKKGVKCIGCPSAGSCPKHGGCGSVNYDLPSFSSDEKKE